MKKPKYKLKKIHNGVWHCSMDNLYDLSMIFCRVQEFYESPYKNIRNKYFTLIEFMDTYSKNRGCECFTYPCDWVGYNIPSKIIEKLYFCGDVTDHNMYDDMIMDMDRLITDNQNNNTEYYLIGSIEKDKVTLAHETVHAFYNLNLTYRKAVNKIIKSDFSSFTWGKLTKTLADIGYTTHVFKDEVNAYLCTNDDVISFGLNANQKKNFEKVQTKLSSLFIEIKNNS